MKKRLIFRIVIYVIISLILGSAVYSWNAKKLVGEQLPMPFGVGAAVVLSGSMEPTYSVDDLIFVSESDTYQVDDIVVFQDAHSLVVHRIVAIDGEIIQTKGDANNVADEPITLNEVKGKVVLHIPGIGAVVNIIKSPAGVITIIVIAVILLELSNRKEKKQDLDDIEKIKEEIRRLREED